MSAPSPAPLVRPVAVFGEDERRSLPPNEAALQQKVGVLRMGTSSFCTAFCISEDVIATASHCLLGTEQAVGPDLERVVFDVGHAGTTRISRLAGGTRDAIRRTIRSGTSRLRITPPIAAANDWAIARLASPVCTAGGLPLSPLTRAEIESRASDGVVFQTAMHRDLSLAPNLGEVVLGGPCELLRSFPGASAEMIAIDFADPLSILMHTCDTGAGSSGSPLLIEGIDGPEVVGINIGTYVLSRTATRNSSIAAEKNEAAPAPAQAIANTAIEVARFRDAARAFLEYAPDPLRRSVP